MQRAPNAKLDRLVDAATEPITLADAKNFLRVEIPDDDDLISDLITAARLECETRNNRSFIATKWRLTLDYFPPFASSYINTNILPALQFGVAAVGGRSLWVNLEAGAIRLPMPPLISVDAIRYTAVDGSPRTLSADPADGLVVVGAGTPGQVAPAFGTIFPLTRPQLGAVEIDFTAGYGPDAASVPRTVRAAMRFLLAHYYEHRTSDAPVPRVVDDLLWNTYWGAS